MEKLLMCRICLAEDVRMYVVTNKSLQEMYEKLADIPFVTEDRRPMLACFYCCTKLKQCYQLQRKCVEAEEVLAQMLNEEYGQKPFWFLQGHQEFAGGFIITPIESISIVDDCQIGSDAVKQELAAVSEEEHDVELKLDHMSEEHQNPENLDISHPDVEYLTVHYSESDSEDGELVKEIKIEGEDEQELSEQKQTARETQNLELENPDKSYPDVADISAPNSESDSENGVPLIVFKTEAKEGQEVSKKKRRATVTKSAPATKKPKLILQKEDTAKSVSLKYKNNGQEHSKNTENKDAIGTKSKENTHTAEKSYKYDICQSSHTTKGNLNVHIRTHTGEEPYKCDICQSTFNELGSLKRHIRKHSSEKPFKCDICQKNFDDVGNLKRHISKHSGDKPYKCDICQSSYTAKGNFNIHIRKHTGEKPYKCDTCQSTFHDLRTFKRHVLKHSGEKPFKCDICQKSFIDLGNLKRHNRKHAGDKLFKCAICPSSFTTKTSLNIHIRTHTGERPYKCDICQCSYATKGNLNVHIRTHTGDKPYKCDICQSSYATKGILNIHIRTHTGERPYKCDICQCSYATKGNLNIHIRTHTGERPYKCDICQRSYATKGSLNVHIRTHTGVKPYKCDICQSTFNELGNLKRHLRIHWRETI